MFLTPSPGELGWREVAKGLVGSVGVVVHPPIIDQDLSLEHGVDDLPVQQLASLLVVVGLDVGILPR